MKKKQRKEENAFFGNLTIISVRCNVWDGPIDGAGYVEGKRN